MNQMFCVSINRLLIITRTLYCFLFLRMIRGQKRGDDQEEGPGSGPAALHKRLRGEDSEERDHEDVTVDWSQLPQEILLQIFQFLPLLDRAFASQVCWGWNQVFHMPELWRCFEFELNQPASSYLKATHPDLIKQIIQRHSNHLQYVSFKVHDTLIHAQCPLHVRAI